MKRLFFLFSVLLIATVSFSQTYNWTKTFGGSGADGGSSVATDPSGNIVVTGFFESTVDLDPGTGTDFHTSNGISDIFILKLDPSGNFLWAKTFGGKWYDQGQSITTDTLGNIFVTGIFADTVDFDPGVGIDSHISGGDYDAFIIKLNASGDFLWAKTYGSKHHDDGSSLVVDNSGDVYITGDFSDTVDFDPGPGISLLSTAYSGESITYILKLDASGNFHWAKCFEGNNLTFSESIARDNVGNIYLAGAFYYTCDFDPGPGVDNHTSNGLTDVYLVKLDSAGSFLWAKTFGGTDYDWGEQISTLLNEIYIGGIYKATVDFDPGPGTNFHSSNGFYDAFVEKLDASGNLLWVKTFGGTGRDEIYSVTSATQDGIYLSGQFENQVDFNPDAGIEMHTSNGSEDIFIEKLDTSGNFLWAKTFGGTLNDVSLGITADRFKNVYATGDFQNTVNFGPGIETDIHTSNGNSDAFVWKLDPRLCSFAPVFASSDTICGEGKVTNLNAQNYGKKYLWSTGDSTQSILVSQGNNYWVMIYDDSCETKDTLKIVKFLSPFLGNDTIICNSNKIMLNAGTSWGNYLWSTGETISSINVQTSGDYSVTVINGSCTLHSNPINVTYFESDTIFVPNLITPNEDYKNDYLEINNKEKSSLLIYNRWGENIFKTTDYRNSWNGKGLPEGIYFYRYETVCGFSKSGWVEIIR